MYGLIKPPGSIVECIIAMSIVFVAAENIFTSELKWWRILIVFCFGLIHGCGFASALTQLGLPKNDYLLSLLSFNLGVELGQVTVIIIAFLVSWKVVFTKAMVSPANCCSRFACYWHDCALLDDRTHTEYLAFTHSFFIKSACTLYNTLIILRVGRAARFTTRE